MKRRFATAIGTAALAASVTFAFPGQAQAAAHSCSYVSTVGYYCGYYAYTATIAEGSGNAAAVMEIQDIINRRTDYPILLDVDGSFGPKTFTAVEWLQSHHHICGGVDGIVGPCTWDYLRGYTN